MVDFLISDRLVTMLASGGGRQREGVVP